MKVSIVKKYNKLYWRYTKLYKELPCHLCEIKNIVHSKEYAKFLRDSISNTYENSKHIPYLAFAYELYGNEKGKNKVLNKNRFDSIHYENAIKYIFEIYADLSKKQLKYNILDEYEVNEAVKALIKSIDMYIECFEGTEKISIEYFKLLVSTLESISDMKNYFDEEVKKRYNKKTLNRAPIISNKEDLDIKWE